MNKMPNNLKLNGFNMFARVFAAVIALVVISLYWPLMMFIGKCSLSCTPEAKSPVYMLSYVSLFLIFGVVFLIFWKLTLKTKKSIRLLVLSFLSLIFIGMLFVFWFISVFDFTEHKYTTIYYGSPEQTYYIDEFKPGMDYLEGNVAFSLYKKRNFIFMEENSIGGSGKLNYAYFNPNSPDEIIRFTAPDDPFYRQTVFYYKPTTKELISPQDYENLK